MIRKWMAIGFVGLLMTVGMSCARNDKTDVGTLRRRQFVDGDVVLSITNGTSLADVEMKLGPAVRHQFTAVEGGHTWTLIRCFLHTGKEESYTFYQLLFRDAALTKTIGGIQMERETYPYGETTATRFKPWRIDDTKYVMQAIGAPAVTPDQIRARLKDAQETMDKYKGHGNIPWVVGYLLSRPFKKLEEKGYPLNEQLRKKFDGCKVSIGMTDEEVETRYGKPLHSFTTDKGASARIYGDDLYLGNSVDSFLVFSYVAVLFDSHGKVAAAYSDRFFCKDWYPGLPAWRRN